MKKLIFFIFLLSTTPHLFAQNKWELVYKIPNGNPPGFAVARTDTNVIYIIGESSTEHWLYKSTNKGSSWVCLKKDYDFKDARAARFISAPDTNVVYVSFLYDGLTYRSLDGGITIERVVFEMGWFI